MSKPELSQEQQKDTSQLTGMLLRDLYLSFRYSQGEEATQRIFFRHLNYFYRTSMDSGSIALLDTIVAKKTIVNRAEKLSIPGRHKPRTNDDASRTFKVNAQRFRKRLLEQPVALDTYDLDIVAMGIAYSDFTFQWAISPRQNPNGDDGHDPHYSYFRDYVLGLRPTGSEGFDSLFADIHSRLINEPPAFVRTLGQIAQLVPKWEETHEGEFFYPTDEIRLALTSSSPVDHIPE